MAALVGRAKPVVISVKAQKLKLSGGGCSAKYSIVKVLRNGVKLVLRELRWPRLTAGTSMLLWSIGGAGVAGLHPFRFSSGLRASRSCGQRSCDRLTTSKQTGAMAGAISGAEVSDGQRLRGFAEKTWRTNAHGGGHEAGGRLAAGGAELRRWPIPRRVKLGRPELRLAGPLRGSPAGRSRRPALAENSNDNRCVVGQLAGGALPAAEAGGI